MDGKSFPFTAEFDFPPKNLLNGKWTENLRNGKSRENTSLFVHTWQL